MHDRNLVPTSAEARHLQVCLARIVDLLDEVSSLVAELDRVYRFELSRWLRPPLLLAQEQLRRFVANARWLDARHRRGHAPRHPASGASVS